MFLQGIYVRNLKSRYQQRKQEKRKQQFRVAKAFLEKRNQRQGNSYNRKKPRTKYLQTDTETRTPERT